MTGLFVSGTSVCSYSCSSEVFMDSGNHYPFTLYCFFAAILRAQQSKLPLSQCTSP